MKYKQKIKFTSDRVSVAAASSMWDDPSIAALFFFLLGAALGLLAAVLLRFLPQKGDVACKIETIRASRQKAQSLF